MTNSRYPRGWDQGRVKRLLEHHDSQSDDEAVAEDEASSESTTSTTMEVPVELVPTVRKLIAKRRAGQSQRRGLTSNRPMNQSGGVAAPRPADYW
jgi:hypothetical protein